MDQGNFDSSLDHITNTLLNTNLTSKGRGRPPKLKCRGVNINDQYTPCPKGLTYSNNTADLFFSYSWCKECQKTYARLYYQLHKDKIRHRNTVNNRDYRARKKKERVSSEL